MTRSSPLPPIAPPGNTNVEPDHPVDVTAFARFSIFCMPKNWIRSSCAFRPTPIVREFAVVTDKLAVLCKAQDILDVTLTAMPAIQNFPPGEILTSNESLPNVRIETSFPSQRVREVAARLKAMQTAVKAEPEKEQPQDEQTHDNGGGGLAQVVVIVGAAH